MHIVEKLNFVFLKLPMRYTQTVFRFRTSMPKLTRNTPTRQRKTKKYFNEMERQLNKRPCSLKLYTYNMICSKCTPSCNFHDILTALDVRLIEVRRISDDVFHTIPY
jgi:hypothetical protein